MDPDPIPEEFFHALATLVARLIFVSEKECGVAPIELLTLWHIRHVGAVNANDQTVVRRNELTRMLEQHFRYSAPDVTRLLDALQEAGHIERRNLTTQERLDLFGEAGHAPVVIINASGKKKIEKFKGVIRSRATDWVSAQPKTTRWAIARARPFVARLARWIVRRYEPERDKLLYAPQKKPPKA